jgi:hypothetical protein
MLHAHLGERARRRVTGQRSEHVGAAFDLDAVVLTDLTRSLAEELAERAGNVERHAARAEARVTVDRYDERPAG